MYFKRLEIQGFKSFADRIVLDLNDGITCIVGPNGSGKSNISDALRWVLGEQSPKSLRGGKMDDVIFAGTATRKPKGMAEVSLVIDNATGILPLEYNEVAVTRRMYRSGESEYLINGNPCRLRDIKELFMDTGIGVDGYSLIGQGKIQEIVSTKPENRREIFEEAAGIVLYKSRKADAVRRMKTAHDNLERVRDIIGEIEGRIGGLKEASEKATEYIALRDRYKYVGVNLIVHSIAGLERSLEGNAEELRLLKETCEAKAEEGERLEEQIEQQRLLSAELGERYEEAHRDLLAKIEELNTIANRGQVNSEKLQGIERALERLADTIDEAEKKLELENANFASLAENEKAYNAEREVAEAQLARAVQSLNEHSVALNRMREEIEKGKSGIIERNNKTVAKRAEITTLENFRRTLRERKSQLEADDAGRDRTDAENRRKLEEIAAAFSAKQAETDAVNGSLRRIAEQLAEDNRRVAELSVAMEEKTIRFNRATARKNTIEEMEHNYEGYNSAVRALMQRRAQGIVGTVSDLISVPKGYELAVETALGGALQNIVCEDDAAAKAAVRWLKEARAGRATFLPVASIKARPSDPGSRVKTAEGFLGVAAELVQAESRYQEIVCYLLGRVLLADDMENAVRLSKHAAGGFRIVTLDGEVINASGAITGGRYKNKTANLLERKKEIETLHAEIEAQRRELERMTKEREGHLDHIRGQKEERASLYERLQQLEIERGVLGSDREHAEALVAAAGSAAAKVSAEIETIEGDLVRAQQMIAKYEAEIAEAAQEIERLEENTEKLLEEEEKYRLAAEADNESIVQSRMLVSEQETKVLSLNELIERVRDTVSDLESTRETACEERDALEKQKELLLGSEERADEKLEELKREREELEQHLRELNASMDKNRMEQEEALNRQKTCHAEAAKLHDEKYKLELKTTKNETLLNTQKDKLWDDFEISYAEAMDLRDEAFAVTAGNKEAREIRLRMSELGDVNISSIEEYRAVSKRYEFMTAQETDLTKAMEELKAIITNMDRTIRERFKENFDKVVINFEEVFRALFGGGHAELRLEDESDPLTSGIEIIAQPPGKKLKNINLMSGGEKTLTAIALMFAVLKAKPTPFCILDEVEAALDEANIERFSRYLKQFDDVQFALITHHKATMEHADVLYGVTMPEQGISRVLSLKFDDNFDPEEYTA